MEELRSDIEMHLDLDTETPTHIEYWKALLVVGEWELAEARKKEALDRARVRGEEPPAEVLAEERGIHSSIEVDVREYLRKKSYSELEDVHAGVEARLRSGSAKILEFWEVILKSIHIYKAKAFLREFHAKMLREAIDSEDDKAVQEWKRMEVLGEQERRIQEARAAKSVLLEDDFEMKARKPKYFSRVHTGYEWNRYNRTHYDHDSLPPKIVQGYKFDIFYPDLVDKSKAPTYNIEKNGNSVETCIIRFHAGPPYEDIAFRIVNKEWEYSRKKGCKCTFERGILHVYFNFKRYHYRR